MPDPIAKDLPGKPTVGFIGLGIMGRPMARNVLAAGFDMVVYDLSARTGQ